ncbi:MAG: hypothetical protein Q7J16_11785 [Candidatus Cloacimonadales bacterium]|nr:hypothetical protein [Candidatus Cloacimonadales bacterium]
MTLVKDFENLLNIGCTRFTENVKYMLYSYGNDMGDESVIKEKMGVKIYDVDNNELLIDRKFTNGFLPNNHYAIGNLFIISSTKYIEEKEDKFEIVNFEDRKIYIKIMPRSERIRLKEITDVGIILRNSDVTKDDIQLLYVNDFIMEDF